MKRKQKDNHPKKGSRITVEPIKSRKDIKSIKTLLAAKPRDLAIFVIGINTNLRASDLVRLKVDQVHALKAGDDLVLKEKKTRKERRITMNKACVEVISNLLASESYELDDNLFLGQRGPIGSIYINHLVKSWASAINLTGNFGAHTLRKTWGYHQRVTFKQDLAVLMECFNHSSQRQTLKYLCIQPDEIKSVYENCL
jgi:integrase